jgi:hypothetical protein
VSLTSVYDPVAVGALTATPKFFNADYVQLELSADAVDETTPQPYAEDGAVYVPIRVWESVQEAMRR